MRNTIRKPSSVLIGFGFAVGLTALPVSSASASLPIPDAWPLTVVTAANFDGSRLVVSYIVDGTHIARRLDRATGQSIELPEFVAISGDTSTLITTDGRWLDVDTGEVNLLDGIDLATVELSADGRTYIATSTDRRTGWVVDAATRTRTPLPIQGTPRSMSSNAR